MPSVSAQYSIILRVEIDHRPGMLGRVATAIGDAGGSIGSVDLSAIDGLHTVRDITVDTAGEEHAKRIAAAVESIDGARLIDTTDRTFLMHVGGKIEQRNKLAVRTRDDLSMAYTPGVARVCSAIAQDRDKAFQYTIKRNTVAVVSDGSAVLGLGDIGPEAAMPVMEGKAVLFKEFAGVDAFPVCLDTQDTDEIVRTVELIAPGFGGVNLEDISAPRCFEIEERLKRSLDIPVFHDDQHGTAVVVLAALLNAVKLTGKRLEDLDVLVVGLGAAGIAVTKILLQAGVSRVIGCDSRGALHSGREDYLDGSMPPMKRWFAESTNPERRSGGPGDVIDGADLFIGLSGARVMPPEALARMNRDAMVFAMANPTPEVTPEEAEPYARVIATGRSDYPNQINNVLCFPGIFRGALDVRAREITEEMKMAAARGIASIVADDELREEYIVPSVFNRDVADAVAAAVADQAKAQGAADAHGDEIGYAPADTEEFRAVRPDSASARSS
ncbi:NAD-dependent malic enzyme [Candidatus Solirubrobacter pratensis]|uniref:NAD-dependent malic enzyme n=1 Tax=Candidatus Solirubrobacter pratensis TaxID=1298857 RepID=UPI0009DBC756|nr:NAD-dependent malic enzyme [Candidatus Solirubrobacter pratensis]